MATQDDALIGTVIAGKYRVEKVVARGGFSTVYRGRDTGIDRLVGIKVLQITSDVEATWLERFTREAKIVSQLTHPNTITVFDFGQVETDFLYLVMEYVRGRSLSRYIKKFGPVPPPRLARFMIDVARSLDEAHHLGILHRDLKPSNIMVAVTSSGEETIRVLDFGVAKILEPASGDDLKLTQVGAFVGTPRYAAPEQLRREELDHRADIYGVGMVMWEALTGKPPVEGTDYGSAIQEHLSAEAWRLPSGIDVPPMLADVVHRCLEKDRADRYISCGQVAADLEEYLGKSTYGRTLKMNVGSHMEQERSEVEESASLDLVELDALEIKETAKLQKERLEFLKGGVAMTTGSAAAEEDAFDDSEAVDLEESSKIENGDDASPEETPNLETRSTERFEEKETLNFDDDDFFGLEEMSRSNSDDSAGSASSESYDDFLAQFDDEEGVPEDLLHGPPSKTPDGRSTRKFVRKSDSSLASPSGRPANPRPQTDPSTRHDWEEPELDRPRPNSSSAERQPREPSPESRPAPRRPRVQNDRSGGSEKKGKAPFIVLILAVLGIVLLSGLLFAYKTVSNFLGEISRASVSAPKDPNVAKAEAEVEAMLAEGEAPPPATALDGTPTISANGVLTALKQGKWRVSDPKRNDLGDLVQTSTMVRKDGHAASITIYETRSAAIAEEMLAATSSPTEGITFGSTLVRVTSGPSSMKSGVTDVVYRLYRFKTIARESASERRP